MQIHCHDFVGIVYAILGGNKEVPEEKSFDGTYIIPFGASVTALPKLSLSMNTESLLSFSKLK